MTTLRQHDDPVTTTASHRRRRVVYIACGAVALLLAVAGAFLIGRNGSPQSTDPIPPPAVSVAPPPIAAGTVPTLTDNPVVTPTTGTGPDGCLGGPDPYTAILPAQAAAALDVNGAAAFARSAFRYMAKAYPRPSDYSVVIPQVFVDPAPWLANLDKPATSPAPEGTTTAFVRPNETSYTATMTGDNADVTVNLFIQLDYPDGQTSQVVVTQRFLLTIQGGRWMIAETPPTDALPPAGTGGSLYFVGAC